MVWCAAIIAHYDSRMHWEKTPWFVVAPALAAVGMLFPRSRIVVVSVFAVQLGALWWKMPLPDNHWAFAGMVSLAMAIGVIVQAVRDRDYGPIGDDWYRAAMPAVRTLIILMYFFAVFHKLNAGFFHSEHSCGMHFYHRSINTHLGFKFLPKDVSESWRYVIIVGVLLTEAAIPFFLSMRRTWLLGIAVGVMFHLTTGLFMRHFPALMFALYISFIPREVGERLWKSWEAGIRKLTGGRLSYIAAVYIQSVIFVLWSVRIWFNKHALGVSKHNPDSGYHALLRTWQVLILIGFAITVALVVRWRKTFVVDEERWQFRKWYWSCQLISLLFFLNCMSPFFGLKTSTSVAMWSNLEVQEDFENHLIIPPGALRIWDYTDDYVVVKQTNVKSWKKRWIRRRMGVPYVTFRRDVQRRIERGGKIDIIWERDGQLYYVSNRSKPRRRPVDAIDDPELTEPMSVFERKVVFVKPFRLKIDRRARCTW